MPKAKTHLSKLSRMGNVLFGSQWLEQYAAICYRHEPVSGEYLTLLITSRGTGRWVIPKGGQIKGKTPRRVASLEAFEEAGIKGKIAKTSLGRYSTVKRLENGQNMPCLVEVFALKVLSMSDAFKEQGQRQAHWVPLAEAGRMVEEPELRGLFTALDIKLRKKHVDVPG